MLERIDKKIKSLTISKERKRTDKFREIVFFNKDVKKWDQALAGILGPPVNTPWKKPDENIAGMTRIFGGIRVGQTVYYKEFEDCRIVAMIWPWKDKIHTTLKLSMFKP